MPRKKTDRSSRSPIVSGQMIPEHKMRLVMDVPINELKIPSQMEDGCGKDTNGIRKYDDQASEAMADSMRKFGFVEPIIASGDNVVIHGVHRLIVARDMLQQATIPVLYVDDWKEDTTTSQFYNVMANKMNDWSTWMSPTVDDIMKSVDGGVGRKVVQGDDATYIVIPDESGPLREMARKLGLFVNVIPRELCATPANLLDLAKMRIKSLGRRYQWNDEQLLFIGSLEHEVNENRTKAIREGFDITGDIMQKKYQNIQFDEKSMNDGKIVARIDLLHSLGISNDEISKIVGVPVNNDKQKKQAKSVGMATFVEMTTVENALWRSAKRDFSPTSTYGWWISKIFTSRDEMLNEPDVKEKLAELEPLRKKIEVKPDKDGLVPPATKLDLDDSKTRKIFNDTVDLIDSKVNDGIDPDSDEHIDRAFIEDWVAWPEALKFYANQCFKYVLEDNARKHPVNLHPKTPMDVKVTRQTNDKLCAKNEWNEIYWLDKLNDGDIVLPELPPLEYPEDDDSDATLQKLTKAAEEKQAKEIEKLKNKVYKEASKIYDTKIPQELNQLLANVRSKYKKGPISLIDMINANHTPEDPDKIKNDKKKEA